LLKGRKPGIENKKGLEKKSRFVLPLFEAIEAQVQFYSKNNLKENKENK